MHNVGCASWWRTVGTRMVKSGSALRPTKSAADVSFRIGHGWSNPPMPSLEEIEQALDLTRSARRKLSNQRPADEEITALAELLSTRFTASALQEGHEARRRSIESTEAYQRVTERRAGLNVEGFLQLLYEVALPPLLLPETDAPAHNRIAALELVLLTELGVSWQTAVDACRYKDLLESPPNVPIERLLAAEFRPFGFDWAQRLAVRLQAALAVRRDRHKRVDKLLRLVREHLVIEILSTADGEFADKVVNAVAPGNVVAGGLAAASVVWGELRALVIRLDRALAGLLEPDDYQPPRPPLS